MKSVAPFLYPPGRFVLLRHYFEPDEGRSHWDLMFEAGESLLTYRLPHLPTAEAQRDIERTIKAERLPDHRRIYLDYEGPIAGNRGAVRREASGTFRVSSAREASCIALLSTTLTAELTIPVAEVGARVEIGVHSWL